MNVEKCVEEFLSADKVLIYDKKYGWYVKKVYRSKENMRVATFNGGDGLVIIDTNEFKTLPKSKQNKILKLINKEK